MPHDPLGLDTAPSVPLAEGGSWRDPESVAADLAPLGDAALVYLTSPEPLPAGPAGALFRRIGREKVRFAVRLSLDALDNRALVEEAARAGCVAIVLEREGALIAGLASGIDALPESCERLITALRRARGVGVATVLHLPLGLCDDDEGIFERTVRFCRRALVSLPIVRSAASGEPDGATAMDAVARAPRMDGASLDNGVRWARRKLTSHVAIWRRSLWPAGTRSLSLAGGYRERRSFARAAQARYTPTMQLLRALNRTARARADRFLGTSLVPRSARLPRRAWLRTKAASDARLRALVIQVEGALDLRGTRGLLKRVGEALQAGYQRVTIDVHGVEAVSLEVVTRLLTENAARLREAAGRVRVENMRGKLEALRAQLGDLEILRVLESAVAA